MIVNLFDKKRRKAKLQELVDSNLNISLDEPWRDEFVDFMATLLQENEKETENIKVIVEGVSLDDAQHAAVSKAFVPAFKNKDAAHRKVVIKLIVEIGKLKIDNYRLNNLYA